MASKAELLLLIKAKDLASDVLDDVNDSVSKTTKETSINFKKIGLASAAGLAVVAGVALKFGTDFKDAFNTIQIGTGATGDELEDLKDDFKEVLRDVPADFQTVANAIADVNTFLGLTGDELQDAATVGVEAARLLGVDAAGLIENVSQALNSAGLDGSQFTTILDQMFVASQKTGIPIAKLSSELETYGPVLTNLGLGLTDQIAFFGQLNTVGIEASRIMPGLNAFMRKLASEGVQDLAGALDDTITEIKEAATSTDALNIASEAFGAEGAQRISVAARAGALDIAALRESLEDGEGAVLDMVDATDTWKEELNRLRNNVLVHIAPLLRDITSATADLVAELNNFVEPVAEVVALIKEVINPISFFDKAMTAISDVMRDAGDQFGNVGRDLQGLINDLQNSLNPMAETDSNLRRMADSGEEAAKSVEAVAEEVAEAIPEVVDFGAEAVATANDLGSLSARAIAAAIAVAEFKLQATLAKDATGELAFLAEAVGAGISKMTSELTSTAEEEAFVTRRTQELLVQVGAIEPATKSAGAGARALKKDLVEIIDTASLVLWADLTNQILAAERAQAAYNDTSGATVRAIETITEAEFELRREQDLRFKNLAANTAALALAGAARAGPAPFGFIIGRDEEGNRTFTARTAENPGVLAADKSGARLVDPSEVGTRIEVVVQMDSTEVSTAIAEAAVTDGAVA